MQQTTGQNARPAPTTAIHSKLCSDNFSPPALNHNHLLHRAHLVQVFFGISEFILFHAKLRLSFFAVCTSGNLHKKYENRAEKAERNKKQYHFNRFKLCKQTKSPPRVGVMS